MSKENVLSEVWLKASILGAIWAASEIILGSFLHNLHVPFKGNILTAIGFILMISVSYKWKDKGLFWRSGLICALMKTMSPSAVIFGPMVAILAEALLLEISVRMLGRNAAGYLLGTSLAMSWILAQKIFNYILYYGFDIVEIYAGLLDYAERQLNTQVDFFWLPVLILLVVYVLFGWLTVFVAMRIGRSLITQSAGDVSPAQKKASAWQINRERDFPYSLKWLAFNITALVGTLILITTTPYYIWMPLSPALVTIWALRYKRALRQISKPKFWIFFVFITLLSSILITTMNGNERTWQDGFMIGIQMNFRAAVLIVGFTVLGTELYNPRVRDYLAGSYFRQVPAALELAFESLPFIIANLPDARTFLRKPASVIKILVEYADHRLHELTVKEPVVFIVTGGVSGGKTTMLACLAGKLDKKGIAAGGFYSPRILEGDITTGYDIVDVSTGESWEFMRKARDNETADIGKYRVNKETLVKGHQLLSPGRISDKKVVIIDEVGRFEMEGKGWRDSLQYLLRLPGIILVLAVRKDFLEPVKEEFGLNDAEIFEVPTSTSSELLQRIISRIKNLSGH